MDEYSNYHGDCKYTNDTKLSYLFILLVHKILTNSLFYRIIYNSNNINNNIITII
jgi:hypothetical protein